MKTKWSLLPLALSLNLATLGLPHLQSANAVATADSDKQIPKTGSADPNDWQHFNPYLFRPAERLVPCLTGTSIKSNVYCRGVPKFPHDPCSRNVIYYGRDTKFPSVIYAKAFDILQLANKYYQAPAAGESKQITLPNGQAVTVYGTTWFTPLKDNRYVGNPAQISPFDPSKVFYNDKITWPAIIYGTPGQDIIIANQHFKIPAAGQKTVLSVRVDGTITSSQSTGTSANSAVQSADNKSNTGSGTGATSSSKPASSSSPSGLMLALSEFI
jgi:hypothetical protein